MTARGRSAEYCRVLLLFFFKYIFMLIVLYCSLNAGLLVPEYFYTVVISTFTEVTCGTAVCISDVYTACTACSCSATGDVYHEKSSTVIGWMGFSGKNVIGR